MFECPRCSTRYDDPPAFCGVCGTKKPGTEPMIAPHGDPLVGLVVDGRYRIIDLIGRGGMGAVYRVEHVKMGKVMAMKLLHGELSRDSDLSRRFKREAETVSRLSHINTVSVFDFGSYNAMMYLVMEYIDGWDLSELVRAEGRLAFLRVAGILIQVCAALNEAHSKGIIHRDLKPENIIVGHRDERSDFVKVLDFGLAKLRDMGDKTRITVKGSLVGTPYYMAPEHIRGESVDPRSDVYALGAVMYKLLTGETPFAGKTPMAIISKHLTEEPEPPSERFPEFNIPEEADDIVLRAMNKDPGDRYQSAEEMRMSLTRALEEATAAAKRPASSVPDVDSSWEMGSSVVEPTNSWEAGKAELATAGTQIDVSKVMPVVGDEDDGNKTLLNEGARDTALSKSIVIGTREVAIGTKSDFIKFEHQLKRRRIVSIVVGSVLGLLAILAVVLYILRGHFDNSNPTLETEPNNSSADSDVLTTNVTLAGYIAGANSTGDVDWYRLPGLGGSYSAFEVSVSGVAGLDLALQLVDPKANEQIATANLSGQGGGEHIPPTVVAKPDAYLIVQEVRAPGIPPGNFNKTPYKLTYLALDPNFVEREPNETITNATPAMLGSTFRGALGANDRVDVYCVGAGTVVSTVQVSGIPGADIKLVLRLGPNASPVHVDYGQVGAGEGVSVPQGPGPTCLHVELKPPATVGGSYSILFR